MSINLYFVNYCLHKGVLNCSCPSFGRSQIQSFQQHRIAWINASVDLISDRWNLMILSHFVYVILHTAAENLNIGKIAFQLSFQCFMELGCFGVYLFLCYSLKGCLDFLSFGD